MKDLTKKLADVQTKLKAKKSSYNSFGKYYFRKAEDILEGVKPFFITTQYIRDDDRRVDRHRTGADIKSYSNYQ